MNEEKHEYLFYRESARSRGEYRAVQIGKRLLEVTSDTLSFDGKTVCLTDVTGIRYGIYERYTNGSRDLQSYCIWITDGISVIDIECSKGLFLKQQTIKQRWREALASVAPLRASVLEKLLRDLRTGKGAKVGEFLIDVSGIHRPGRYGSLKRSLIDRWSKLTNGLSADERERDHFFLPWVEYRGHDIENGTVKLYRQGNKTPWGTVSFRLDWNAVCLDRILAAVPGFRLEASRNSDDPAFRDAQRLDRLNLAKKLAQIALLAPDTIIELVHESTWRESSRNVGEQIAKTHLRLLSLACLDWLITLNESVVGENFGLAVHACISLWVEEGYGAKGESDEIIGLVRRYREAMGGHRNPGFGVGCLFSKLVEAPEPNAAILMGDAVFKEVLSTGGKAICDWRFPS